MCKLYERPRFQSSWLNWGGFPFFFIGCFLIPLLCVTDHDLNSFLFVFTKYKTSWHLDYFLEQLHCWRFVFLLFVPRLCGITRFLKCPCPSLSTKHRLFCKTFLSPWTVVPFGTVSCQMQHYWVCFLIFPQACLMIQSMYVCLHTQIGYLNLPMHWRLGQ